MNRYSKYKIVIAFLSLIIIFQIIILIRFMPKKPKRVAPIFKGSIAIVIDDWGYNLNNLHFLNEIYYPLTISILPGLTYSKRVAETANNRGLEVILHLPLEPMPSEKMGLERNTIKVDMDDKQIREIITEDLGNLQYVRGVSNHMGSRATADPLIMKVIFKEMQKNDLYFLDSLVSKKSICEKLARNMNIKFAKRDIFLDNKNDPEYIKGQINQLQSRAQKQGFAIGIGHDRRLTLEILKEVMPELEEEGFRFVFVSDLIS